MITCYVGWPGTGKTQAMVDHIRSAPGWPYLVLDRAREWDASSPRWRGDPPQNLRIVEPRATASDVREPGVYLFRPPYEPYEVVRLAIAAGNTVYVDDEIDLFARVHGWEENPLRDVVHRGRHLEAEDGEIAEVHILCAMRRPQSCHPDLTAIAESAHIFRVGGSHTLTRLRADAWIEPEDEQRIRELPDLTYLHWPSREIRKVQNAFRGTPK